MASIKLCCLHYFGSWEKASCPREAAREYATGATWRLDWELFLGFEHAHTVQPTREAETAACVVDSALDPSGYLVGSECNKSIQLWYGASFGCFV